MNRTILGLSGLLVAQVALAAGLSVSGGGFAAEATPAPLVSFAPDTVARVAITGDGATVTLVKDARGWTVAEAGGFPADGAKVKTFLSQIAKARESAPVATSANAPARFKVAGDAYARRLVFGKADAPLATVYLGQSQGTQKTYVRREGQSGVRLVALPIYQVPDTIAAWIDHAALQVTPAQVKSLSWNGLTLSRAPKVEDAKAAKPKADGATAKADGAATAAGTPDAKAQAAPQWQVAKDGAAPVPADQKAAEALVSKLSHLWIDGLAPKAKGADPAKDAAKPALKLVIALKSGPARTYVLRPAPDGSFTVTDDALPRAVTLSKDAGEALIKAAGAAAPLPAPGASVPRTAEPQATPGQSGG